MKYLFLLLPLLLSACLEDKTPSPYPGPPARDWTHDYNLECDATARTKHVKACIAAYYRRNPAENPQLESEAYDRCRLAASVMFCTWRKP